MLITYLALTLVFVGEILVNSPNNIGALNSLALAAIIWIALKNSSKIGYAITAVLTLKAIQFVISLAMPEVGSSSLLTSWQFMSLVLWAIALVSHKRTTVSEGDFPTEATSTKRVQHQKIEVTSDMLTKPDSLYGLHTHPEITGMITKLIAHGYRFYYFKGVDDRYDIHKPTGVIAHIHHKEGLLNFLRNQVI